MAGARGRRPGSSRPRITKVAHECAVEFRCPWGGMHHIGMAMDGVEAPRHRRDGGKGAPSLVPTHEAGGSAGPGRRALYLMAVAHCQGSANSAGLRLMSTKAGRIRGGPELSPRPRAAATWYAGRSRCRDRPANGEDFVGRLGGAASEHRRVRRTVLTPLGWNAAIEAAVTLLKGDFRIDADPARGERSMGYLGS